GYMAPEQVTGDRLDARADLFSLGCILYEMATGRLAFDGPNVLALLANLAMQAPAPPESLNPELPPALSALILSTIDKQVDRRPSTAQEVLDALERIGAPHETPGPQSTRSPQPRVESPPPSPSLLTLPTGSNYRAEAGPDTEPDSAAGRAEVIEGS